MQTTIKQLQALIEDVTYETSILANASAFLNQIMEDVSWVGFYLYHDDKLVLGPFQGKVACTTIPLNQGVCGKAASEQKTIIVPDVHQFKGHIACDSASCSEIVVPIIKNQKLYGVLDIDSTSFHRFHKEDKDFLEACVEILIKKLA